MITCTGARLPRTQRVRCDARCDSIGIVRRRSFGSPTQRAREAISRFRLQLPYLLFSHPKRNYLYNIVFSFNGSIILVWPITSHQKMCFMVGKDCVCVILQRRRLPHETSVTFQWESLQLCMPSSRPRILLAPISLSNHANLRWGKERTCLLNAGRFTGGLKVGFHFHNGSPVGLKFSFPLGYPSSVSSGGIMGVDARGPRKLLLPRGCGHVHGGSITFLALVRWHLEMFSKTRREVRADFRGHLLYVQPFSTKWPQFRPVSRMSFLAVGIEGNVAGAREMFWLISFSAHFDLILGNDVWTPSNTLGLPGSQVRQKKGSPSFLAHSLKQVAEASSKSSSRDCAAWEGGPVRIFCALFKLNVTVATLNYASGSQIAMYFHFGDPVLFASLSIGYTMIEEVTREKQIHTSGLAVNTHSFSNGSSTLMHHMRSIFGSSSRLEERCEYSRLFYLVLCIRGGRSRLSACSSGLTVTDGSDVRHLSAVDASGSSGEPEPSPAVVRCVAVSESVYCATTRSIASVTLASSVTADFFFFLFFFWGGGRGLNNAAFATRSGASLIETISVQLNLNRKLRENKMPLTRIQQATRKFQP
eukprot:284816677_5